MKTKYLLTYLLTHIALLMLRSSAQHPCRSTREFCQYIYNYCRCMILHLFLAGARLVGRQVDVLRVVLLLQLRPLGGLVVDEEAQHLVATVALGLTALAALGLQRIGQHALQLAAVGRALALVHHALEVVVEQAIGLQDLIQINAIVLGGVLLRAGSDARDQHGQNGQNGDFHLQLENNIFVTHTF